MNTLYKKKSVNPNTIVFLVKALTCLNSSINEFRERLSLTKPMVDCALINASLYVKGAMLTLHGKVNGNGNSIIYLLSPLHVSLIVFPTFPHG